MKPSALASARDAFLAGRNAALRGQSVSSVYYKNPLREAAWLKGFETAKRRMEKTKGQSRQ